MQQLENIETNWKSSRPDSPTHYDAIDFNKLSVVGYVINDVIKHRIPYNFEVEQELVKFFREQSPYKSHAEISQLLIKKYPKEKSNTLRSENHSWDWKTFFKLIRCAYCKKMLVGFHHQGMQCQVCGVVAHEQCTSKLDKDKTKCKGDVCLFSFDSNF